MYAYITVSAKVIKALNASGAPVPSVYFNDPESAGARPGQFVMVWEPGYDEFPMSLSNYDARGLCSVTVKPWGPGSGEMVKQRRGDLIGVRGPYGRPFTVEKNSALNR